MSGRMEPAENQILATQKTERALDIPKAMSWAREKHGRARWKQLLDLARLSLGRQHFEPEYFNLNGFFHIYQRAADRGVLNSDFQSHIAAAEAETKRLLGQYAREAHVKAPAIRP